MASQTTTFDSVPVETAAWNKDRSALTQPIPLGGVALLAVAVHLPLLMMQVPMRSLDATNHLFFAQHYAQSWFQPWNEKWFGGFSQTTAPPLAHQWIALAAEVMNVRAAYMLVQMVAIVFLTVGVYRFARLWVGERSASLAATASVFLGSLALLVYEGGQLPTVLSTALLVNAFAYGYEWFRDARFGALLTGVALYILAATADHITFIAGTLLFGVPLMALSSIDRKEAAASSAGVLTRAVIFMGVGMAGAAVAMLPFWVHFFAESFPQLPPPHGSRSNFLLDRLSGLQYWLLPMGALALALPFAFRKGLTESRLLPLGLAFLAALVLGLGGSTPIPRILFGDAFAAMTFDRFTFWATLLMLPLAGVLAARLMKRYELRAIVTLAVLAVLSFGSVFFWLTRTININPLPTSAIVGFLGRDGHDRYRYLTLGFGYNFADVAMNAPARTVDGAFAGGRLLPELEPYGWLRLDQAREYGSAGMEGLRAVLKHANNYGLKYVFVRDPYYEPLLAFAGWRPVERVAGGTFSIWSKEDVPTARPMSEGLQVSGWQRYLWGTLPMATTLLALVFIAIFRRRTPVGEIVVIPAEETAALREAN